MAASTISEEEFLNLKLSLGSRFLNEDLSLRMVELEDSFSVAMPGLFIGVKLTLFGVGRMFILTKSSGESCTLCDGISPSMLCGGGVLRCPRGHSSVISVDSTICKSNHGTIIMQVKESSV